MVEVGYKYRFFGDDAKVRSGEFNTLGMIEYDVDRSEGARNCLFYSTQFLDCFHSHTSAECPSEEVCKHVVVEVLSTTFTKIFISRTPSGRCQPNRNCCIEENRR
jgi:hypothetical protein